MHDLRHDPDAPPGGADQVQADQVQANHDCTVWTALVEQRLAALEAALARQADVLQVLLLRQEDGE